MSDPIRFDDSINSEEGRYDSIRTADGETILYDRENADAWIQSDLTVSVGSEEA